MAYIGRAPSIGTFTKQDLTGDGSTTTFTLTNTVGSESAILVSVGGVIQEPKVAYTLGTGGTQIVFTTAPSSTDNVYIHFLGNSVTQNLNNVRGSEFILDADSDTSFTADTDDEIDIKVGGTDRSTIKTTGFHNIDSYKFVAGTGDDLEIYHDGTNSFIANKTGALKLATETSGIAITLGHTTSEVTVADNMTVAGDLTVTGTLTQTGVQTFDGGIDVDNFNINGTTIALSTGDMLFDSSGDIILDAGGADIILKDDNTTYGTLTNTSGNLIIKSGTTTAATFAGANVTFAGTIDSGAITSTGVVTATGFTIGSAVITETELEILDGLAATTAELAVIDGGATIGTTAIADGDGIIHNDGGTMKVTTASTFKTYFQEGLSANTPSSADGQALGSASLEWSDLFLADASTIQFGADQDVIITHVADTGLLLSGTNVIQFNDASQNIGAPSATVLDINATDEIELNATLVDVNANLDVSGTITSGGVITGTGFTAGSAVLTEAELEKLDGITNGAGAANKALVLDGSADVASGLRNLTASGTITSGGIVTGTAFTAGSAVLAEAELELLDGLTAGTAIASKVVTTDANIDSTGMRNLTISGEIDAATGDFSGAVDVAGATTTAAITASGIIKTDDATDATSTTDGSLQTDGGLSVAKDAVIGDDLLLLSDASVIKFGADSDVTLTHEHNVGLILGGANPVFTIGDGGAEDAHLRFDGNAQNFHIGLDDSTDKLTIGLGNALGTTPGFTMDENTNVVFPDNSVTIVSSGNGANLTLTTTDADSGFGPIQLMYRNSSSPADGDDLGKIEFRGRNDNSQDVNYGILRTQIRDASDGTEDGKMDLGAILAGSEISWITFDPADPASVIVNEGSKDINFRVESDDSTKAFFVSGTKGNCHISGAGSATKVSYYSGGMGSLQLGLAGQIFAYDYSAIDGPYIGSNQWQDNGTSKNVATGKSARLGMYDGTLLFQNAASQSANASSTNTVRLRIDNDGDFYLGTAAVGTQPEPANTNTIGAAIQIDGELQITVDSSQVARFNRKGDDGEIIGIMQDGSVIGTISTSGSTASYNAFTGSHWGRLADNSKPTILVGTVIETLDAMINWHYANMNFPERTVGGETFPAYTKRHPLTLPDGKAVGDAVTFTVDSVEYTDEYRLEADIKHTQVKVSDTANSKRVYGVFSNWDNSDIYNDMYVAQVGTFVVRVHSDETVAGGNLLVSKGDGTAKVLAGSTSITADVQSSIIAKVNSNVKIETYADGSYTVPCTLQC